MTSRFPHSPGIYQCFACLWHLDRGDVEAARAVLLIPPEMMTAFDDLMRAAWIVGAIEASKK